MRLLLRPLFWLVARRYRPDVLPGFQGTIVYELSAGRRSAAFAVDVSGSRAVAFACPPGASWPPAATLRLPLSDFLRVGLGRLDPAEPLLSGRASATGDLALLSMLPEMFGARRLR